MPFKNPHPLYTVWRSMRDRCMNPNFRQWNDYGGRGIKICPEWDSFHQFVEDMGPRPQGYTLDRIDNNGNYEPSNCRWATRKEQQRNRRMARRVVLDGEEYLVAELVEKYGLKHETIVQRAAKGMSFKDATAKTRYAFKGGWKKAVAVRVANQRARTHCKHGHEFTPENTYLTPQGHRVCRRCHALKARRQYARKRGKAKPPTA